MNVTQLKIKNSALMKTHNISQIYLPYLIYFKIRPPLIVIEEVEKIFI